MLITRVHVPFNAICTLYGIARQDEGKSSTKPGGNGGGVERKGKVGERGVWASILPVGAVWVV